MGRELESTYGLATMYGEGLLDGSISNVRLQELWDRFANSSKSDAYQFMHYFGSYLSRQRLHELNMRLVLIEGRSEAPFRNTKMTLTMAGLRYEAEQFGWKLEKPLEFLDELVAKKTRRTLSPKQSKTQARNVLCMPPTFTVYFRLENGIADCLAEKKRGRDRSSSNSSDELDSSLRDTVGKYIFHILFAPYFPDAIDDLPDTNKPAYFMAYRQLTDLALQAKIESDGEALTRIKTQIEAMWIAISSKRANQAFTLTNTQEYSLSETVQAFKRDIIDNTNVIYRGKFKSTVIEFFAEVIEILSKPKDNDLEKKPAKKMLKAAKQLQANLETTSPETAVTSLEQFYASLSTWMRGSLPHKLAKQQLENINSHLTAMQTKRDEVLNSPKSDAASAHTSTAAPRASGSGRLLL